MRDAEPVLLRGDESVDRALTRASLASSGHFLVSLGEGQWGAVSRWELEQHSTQGRAGELLSSIVPPIPGPYLYADQSIEFALRVLRAHPVVPVVHRAASTRIVGMLVLDDVVRLHPRE
jgi:CBS domain-containing protein